MNRVTKVPCEYSTLHKQVMESHVESLKHINTKNSIDYLTLQKDFIIIVSHFKLYKRWPNVLSLKLKSIPLKLNRTNFH